MTATDENDAYDCCFVAKGVAGANACDSPCRSRGDPVDRMPIVCGQVEVAAEDDDPDGPSRGMELAEGGEFVVDGGNWGGESVGNRRIHWLRGTFASGLGGMNLDAFPSAVLAFEVHVRVARL